MPLRLSVVPALLAAALLAPAWAGEAQDSTEWEVRRDAKVLLDDLAKKNGDQVQLLERAQKMISEHGTDLVALGNGVSPLAEAIGNRLHESGLSDAFLQLFTSAAERRLAEALALPQAGRDGALQRLALSYPGTAAATKARRLLADRAWDRGQLGRYLDEASRAGDAADAVRSARRRAALDMLTINEVAELPRSLDGLEPMWTMKVDEIAPPEMRPQPRLVAEDQPTRATRRRLVIGASAGDVAAASDGLRLLVCDLLVGQLQGQVHRLGNTPLPARQCQPVAIAGGWAALGLIDQHRLVVRAVDRVGRSLWMWQDDESETNPVVSAPVAADGLVLIASANANSQGSVDVLLTALDARTGQRAWKSLVTRVPQSELARMRWGGWGGPNPSSPALAIQAGSILVLSNLGVLARVATTGEVRRVWSYRSMPEDGLDENAGVGRRDRMRQGAVKSDGVTAVATPGDNQGIALILGPDDAKPREFIGNGAGDEVLAVSGGSALLAGRSITWLDLATLLPRWPGSRAHRLTDPQAIIGVDRILVGGSDGLFLLDRKDGQQQGIGRSLIEPFSLAGSQQVLLMGYADRITALGGSAALLERLRADLAANPHDVRRLVALASLLEARNEPDAAVDHLLRALEAGAPKDYAERAARILRRQLDLATGDAKVFPSLFARFAKTVAADPALTSEQSWWRGRHAEMLGDRNAAIAAYAAAITTPGRMVNVRDRLEVHAHLLARAGQGRLGVGGRDLWSVPAAVTPATVPAKPWSAPGRRGPVTVATDELAISYVDGCLTALRLADGSVAWVRKGLDPRLGISPTNGVGLPLDAPAGAGIPINVLPGTAAEASGMRSGDRLLEFNGHAVVNWRTDLQEHVFRLAPRTPFTVVVGRGGERVTCAGKIGHELVEPLTANRRTVLVRTTVPANRRTDATLFVVDLATGVDLWSKYVPPPRREDDDVQGLTTVPPNVLISPDNVVIGQDGVDLVGWKAHDPAPDGPVELWRQPGRAVALAQARCVGDDLVWLPASVGGSAQLIRTATGEALANVPAESERVPILGVQECFTLGADHRVSRWDLGLGRRSWQSDANVARILAVRGDALYAITDGGQLAMLDLASGAPRRIFGDWQAVEALDGGPARATPDLLHLRYRKEGRTGLAVVSLAGGAVRWETLLPASTELVRALPAGGGVCGLLRESDAATGLIVLDASGSILQAVRLSGNQRTVVPIPSGNAILLPASDGLSVLPSSLPPTIAPVPTCRLAGGAEMVERLRASALAWQPSPAGRWAVARDGRDLLFVIGAVSGGPGGPGGPGGKSAILRLGNDGAAIDPGLQRFVIAADRAPAVEPATPVSNGWTMVLAARIELPDGPVSVLRLSPGLETPLADRVVVHIEPEGATDGPPWWWRAAWRPLAPPAP